MKVRIVTDGCTFKPLKRGWFRWKPFWQAKAFGWRQEFDSIEKAQQWLVEEYGAQFKYEHTWVPAVRVK